MGNKPPAAVDERIYKDGRHSITTSSLQGRAGGSAFTPKLVELVFGPGSTRRAEKQSPSIACTAVRRPPCARESQCLRAHLPPWRDVAAEIHAPGVSNAFLMFLSVPRSDSSLALSVDIHPPSWVGQTQVYLGGARGHCPRGLP